jgi:ribosomal protein L11 methyltransferase
MHYRFDLIKSSLEGTAKTWLRAHGLKHLYVVEQQNRTQIGGFGEVKAHLPSFLKLIEITDEIVSWEEQWENKIVQVPIGERSFSLSFGPGFGDATHPTTLLCLSFLEKLKPKEVIDLGSGSGILSIAALSLGANHVIGVEIDEAAILHHQKNLLLNDLSPMMITTSLDEAKIHMDNPTIVINMILMEQKELLDLSKDHLISATTWITSGFLESQRSEALKFYSEIGLQLVEEKFRDGWGAFILEKKGA